MKKPFASLLRFSLSRIFSALLHYFGRNRRFYRFFHFVTVVCVLKNKCEPFPAKMGDKKRHDAVNIKHCFISYEIRMQQTGPRPAGARSGGMRIESHMVATSSHRNELELTACICDGRGGGAPPRAPPLPPLCDFHRLHADACICACEMVNLFPAPFRVLLSVPSTDCPTSLHNSYNILAPLVNSHFPLPMPP